MRNSSHCAKREQHVVTWQQAHTHTHTRTPNAIEYIEGIVGIWHGTAWDGMEWVNRQGNGLGLGMGNGN